MYRGVPVSAYVECVGEVWIHFKGHKEGRVDLFMGCMEAKFVSLSLWVQKKAALGLFVKYMGRLWCFCRVRDWEGRFLMGSLTVVVPVRMQCGWQQKLGCSIWLPWQLLDIA